MLYTYILVFLNARALSIPGTQAMGRSPNSRDLGDDKKAYYFLMKHSVYVHHMIQTYVRKFKYRKINICII